MPRAKHHNYRLPSIYHITMCKRGGVPDFGQLAGGVEGAYVELSEMGKVIERGIRGMAELAPGLQVLQYVVMPDHVHILLHVRRELPRVMGSYIGMFKVRMYQELRSSGKWTGGLAVFEDDFYDTIIYRSRSLDQVFSYIRQNPYRLAVRQAFPEYFRRVNSLEIYGRRVQAYGNLLLLRSPFKQQVVVHRHDTPAENRALHDRWIHAAANGGVLVSPFISPAEKRIRAGAEASGGKVILIQRGAMGERDKPAGHDFELCAAGRLLILSVGGPVTGEGFTREECLAMNELARRIAEGG